MKKPVLFLIMAVCALLLLSGCSSPQAPPAEKLLQPNGDDGKRDNILGQQDYAPDNGTALIDSNQSFEDFDEIEYQETLKDVNVESIITDCSTLTDQVQKDNCLWNNGVDKEDESYCQQISSAYLKLQCIRAVALSKLDASVCKKIVPEQGVFACIAAIASDEAVLDEKLCSQIPESSAWRQKCLDRVKKQAEQAAS